MEEIHDAIQDARYMGAMADPIPRPSMPLMPLSPEEIARLQEIISRDPRHGFRFLPVLEEPLGYYMVRLLVMRRVLSARLLSKIIAPSLCLHDDSLLGELVAAAARSRGCCLSHLAL